MASGDDGAGLHRQMQAQVRMLARGVIEHADIGEDHRVAPSLRGVVDRVAPQLERAGRAERC